MHDPDRPESAPEPDSAPAADQAPAADPSSAAEPGPDSSPAPAAAPRPQPKSAYELPSRKNTVLRNMVWALLLTMAVVVVVAIAFFGVGSDLERTPLENSELDATASAERAEEVAPFPVALPQLGEGWSERNARFTDGANPRWLLQYTSPEGQLVTLVEESEVSASMLSTALPGSTVDEEFTLEGTECTLLRGGEDGAEHLGIACDGEDWGLLVHGATERVELEDVARAAIDDIA